MMRLLRRIIGRSVGLAVGMIAAFVLWAMLRGGPQDLLWTPLDLGGSPGPFTARKLAALGDDARQCRALLDRAGVRYTVQAPVRGGAGCGYADGIRFASGGTRRIAMRPAAIGVACPVAAALAMWEWTIVQPAAQRRFGAAVVAIDHFGSYNCRRISGRGSGIWSEHATADAIDIAGFRLADGTRITVARDWRGRADKAAFLRDVRDGACTVFATTLSPDYNAAHADHLHLDEANRGAIGGQACR